MNQEMRLLSDLEDTEAALAAAQRAAEAALVPMIELIQTHDLRAHARARRLPPCVIRKNLYLRRSASTIRASTSWMCS